MVILNTENLSKCRGEEHCLSTEAYDELLRSGKIKTRCTRCKTDIVAEKKKADDRILISERFWTDMFWTDMGFGGS